MKNLLQEAGFIDIIEQKTKAPFHGWPSDPKLREAGTLFQLVSDESLSSFGMHLFEQILALIREDVELLILEMRKVS